MNIGHIHPTKRTTARTQLARSEVRAGGFAGMVAMAAAGPLAAALTGAAAGVFAGTATAA